MTALRLAIKIEEPKRRSYQELLDQLPRFTARMVTIAQLVKLEAMILKDLKWQLHFNAPVTFLERFLRLFNLEEESESLEALQVGF